MPNEPESLILRQLRAMDAKLDRLLEDVSDLKVRATSVEEALAGVNRRLDRVEQRVDRIERRLDLTLA
ncbi:MAG: hypothetical protein MUC58_00340 [Rhizobiaceae bacterium]|jgi:predicted  nucleic acid-binding Zn-ribbon protein|nr:hypothetical protein [Rhizobiaceae bacterium]